MKDSQKSNSTKLGLTRRCWFLAGLTLLPFWSIIIYYAVSENSGLPMLILKGAAVIMGVVNLFFLIYFTFIKPVRGDGGELKPMNWKPPVNLKSYRQRVILVVLLPFFYLLISQNETALEVGIYIIFMAGLMVFILSDLQKCELEELKKYYYIISAILILLTVVNLYFLYI